MFGMLKKKEKLFEEIYSKFYTSADEFIESLEIVKRSHRRERNTTPDYARRLIDLRKRILKDLCFSKKNDRRSCPICGRHMFRSDLRMFYITCSCESFQCALKHICRTFHLY